PFLSEKLEYKKPVVHTFTRPPTYTARRKRPPTQKAVEPFPKILYKGSLDVKNGQKKALVNIAGKTFNWAPGERVDALLLEQIFEDSIRVRFNERQQTFLKATD
ncbi:MAG: hypothetical protein AAGD05_19585, partial [Bacteroidota bacterium]